MTPMTAARKTPDSEEARKKAEESEYNRAYYQANKRAISDARSERYASDPKYRRKVLLANKRRHWLGPRLDKPTPEFGSMDAIHPQGQIPLRVRNPKDTRHGQLLMLDVYTTTHVAGLLGTTPATIRLWYKRQQFPEPYLRSVTLEVRVVPGRNPRLFTRDEMMVLDTHKEKLALPDWGKKHGIFVDAVTKDFAKLKQGLALRAK